MSFDRHSLSGLLFSPQQTELAQAQPIAIAKLDALAIAMRACFFRLLHSDCRLDPAAFRIETYVSRLMMATTTDIDVLVSDNTAVDLLLFQYWLDGYSGKNQVASITFIEELEKRLSTNNTKLPTIMHESVSDAASIVRRNESEFLKNFSEDLVIADTLDQYRTFALIEKLLPCPAKLSEDWTFRMAESTKLTLVEKFYDFDETVMRAILGKQLSARSRKDLDEVSRKSGKSLKSCRRQFDNFKRIFKTIDGLPGNMVTNIQNHFLLSDSLAQKYANHICYNRFELNKRRPFRGWTAMFRS